MPAKQGNIAREFVVFTPGMDAVPERNRPTLYQELDRDYDNFAGHVLVSQYTFSENWPTWEIHPKGDELVTLIAGRATMVLDSPEGERCVVLAEPGDYVVVPRNTWHTARVEEPCTLQFFTPGQGTENREAGTNR
ncbi:cupin domain-containing protein [Parahaliea mediterranea]|uniref:Cupin domain-containing protein n=1 Tax=Parahaliea mediterranea TaxID=651086 RepID=A0A939DDE8_9GAMM|nr:cupin domain-containing protein [Parahaliea mediterranea]MBN7796193.1 cupin domain-containing protein [Parahaliea mediterranea]